MIINTNTSLMECLTAFAIVMVTAAITAIGLAEYIHALKRDHWRH
jgi:hypothetical protein